MTTVIRRATASDHPALVAFFEAAGSRCYCHYHDFSGDGRAWQASMVQDGEGHRRALAAGLASGTMRAFIAVEDERVVGWMRFGPPGGNRQYAQRVYRDLPCLSGERSRTLSVYCFLVDPSQRRRGLGRRLVRALMDAAQLLGSDAIEALPRGVDGVMDEELWTGPLGLFRDLGFRIVHDFAPYPVVRLESLPAR